MRVMRRKLASIAVALSLLMMVAVCTLWAVSYSRAVQLWYMEPAGAYRNARGHPYREDVTEVFRGHVVWLSELRPGRPRGTPTAEFLTNTPVLLVHGGPQGGRWGSSTRRCPGLRAAVRA